VPVSGIETYRNVTSAFTGTKQPPMTRSSVLSVTAGQTVVFGVYLGGLGGGWYNTPYAATTSYLCS
jgi:hypothetical protein